MRTGLKSALVIFTLFLAAAAAAVWLMAGTDPDAAAGRRQREDRRRLTEEWLRLGVRPSPPVFNTRLYGRPLAVPRPGDAMRMDIPSPLPEYRMAASFLAMDEAEETPTSYSLSEVVGSTGAVGLDDFADFRRRLKDHLGVVALPAETAPDAEAPLAVTLSPVQPSLLLEENDTVITTALRQRVDNDGRTLYVVNVESFVLWENMVLRLTVAAGRLSPQPPQAALKLLQSWRRDILAANAPEN